MLNIPVLPTLGDRVRILGTFEVIGVNEWWENGVYLTLKADKRNIDINEQITVRIERCVIDEGTKAS